MSRALWAVLAIVSVACVTASLQKQQSTKWTPRPPHIPVVPSASAKLVTEYIFEDIIRTGENDGKVPSFEATYDLVVDVSKKAAKGSMTTIPAPVVKPAVDWTPAIKSVMRTVFTEFENIVSKNDTLTSFAQIIVSLDAQLQDLGDKDAASLKELWVASGTQVRADINSLTRSLITMESAFANLRKGMVALRDDGVTVNHGTPMRALATEAFQGSFTGVCVDRDPCDPYFIICKVKSQCHLLGECYVDKAAKLGVCPDPTKPDNTPCNDANPLTDDDVCYIGVCKGQSRDVSMKQLLGSGGCDLTTTFRQGIDSFPCVVDNSVTSVTLTVVPTYAQATFRIEGGSALIVGANTILITVTAENTKYVKSYRVVVTRKQNEDSSLSALTIDSGCGITFNKATLQYTCTVENEIGDVVVVATPSYNLGSAVVSGASRIVVGPNTVLITTSAENKAFVTVYKVIITRKPSTDCKLSALAVDGGCTIMGFTPDVMAYVCTIENEVTVVVPTFTVRHPPASAKANGATGLHVGSNDLRIVSTAEDATTVCNYLVTITRKPSSNANLGSIDVDSGCVLDPVFSAATTNYRCNVANDVTSVTLTPRTQHSEGKVVVTGTTDFKVGENLVKMSVTAEDKTTTKSYVLLIIRAPSSESKLASLSLNNGCTLFPEFVPTTLSYSCTVETAITSVTPSGTAVHGQAVVANAAPALVIGSNTLSVTVTAEDKKSVSVYNVAITRKMSNDASLRSLSVDSGCTLTPAFDMAVLSYTCSIPYETTAVVVSPVPSFFAAKLAVKYPDGRLVYNTANTVTVTVTSQDDAVSRVYTIAVTRAGPTGPVLAIASLANDDTFFYFSPSWSTTVTPFKKANGNELTAAFLEIPVAAIRIEMNGFVTTLLVPPPPDGYEYVGCYVDDGNRDLRQGPMNYGYGVGTCSSACASFPFYALQNQGWCVCGNGYSTRPQYTKVPDAQCGADLSGGPWRNAVYRNLRPPTRKAQTTGSPLAVLVNFAGGFPLEEKGNKWTATNPWGLNRDGHERYNCAEIGFNYETYFGTTQHAGARIGMQLSQEAPCDHPGSSEGIGLKESYFNKQLGSGRLQWAGEPTRFTPARVFVIPQGMVPEWSLAATFEGGSPSWRWGSDSWTSTTLSDNKFDPFLWPTLLVKLEFALGPRNAVILTLPDASKSIQQIFASGRRVLQTVSLSQWRALLVGGGAVQPWCNYQGFNVQLPWSNARIGIIYNENNPGDCSSPDVVTGVGMTGWNSNQFSAANWVGCCQWGPGTRVPTAFIYVQKGWRLALSINGYKNTFFYASPLWTNTDLFNADGEVKTSDFMTKTMMIRLVYNTGDYTGSLAIDLPDNTRSLRDIFASNAFVELNLPLESWKWLMPDGGATQDFCNRQGFNVNLPWSQARLGMIYNENGPGDCSTPDVVTGIGIRGWTNNQFAAANWVGCCQRGPGTRIVNWARLFIWTPQ